MKCGVEFDVRCEVWSVECGVESAKSEVCSVMYGV